jgi:hypothetical protein
MSYSFSMLEVMCSHIAVIGYDRFPIDAPRLSQKL